MVSPLNQGSTVSVLIVEKKIFLFNYFLIVFVEVGCDVLYIFFPLEMIKDINDVMPA